MARRRLSRMAMGIRWCRWQRQRHSDGTTTPSWTKESSARFPLVWVRTHDEYYKDTTLRHQVVTSSHEHARRDLFAELVGPARTRGMKVYARILESSCRSFTVSECDRPS